MRLPFKAFIFASILIAVILTTIFASTYSNPWYSWQAPVTLRVVEEEEKPDFRISEVKPVQVVWNPDINDDGRIDLVAGKSTMVRVKVGMRNYEALEETTEVEIQLQVPQYPTDDFIIPKIYVAYPTIEYLKDNKGVIDFYIDAPALTGDWTIFAMIDPGNSIEEADEANNEDSVEITIKDTRGLHIAYFPIERLGSYGSLQKYDETVNDSNEFIQAVYPISEQEFMSEKRNEALKGSRRLWPRRLGIWLDAVEVYTRAKFLGADVGIGIVPKGYFDYHGVDTFGMTFPGIKGAVVEEGTWATVAHEIGHMYGLEDEDPMTAKASGFWVAKKQPIESSLYLDFMTGAELYVWVSNESYAHLFQKFRLDKKDPEILLVDGVIYKNGTIDLGKWHKIEEGKDDLEEIVPGDYSLQIVDENGTILQEVSFSAEFEALAFPLGIIEIDFAPFAFAIPYQKNASGAKILYKNEVIAEVELTTKLLHDAMDRLIGDYETLIETVEKTNIKEEVKNSLLEKLTNATMKAEQGLAYIYEGHYVLGENMLNSASNIIEAFFNEVHAQKGKKISEEDAKRFISWAQKMILGLQNQITGIV